MFMLLIGLGAGLGWATIFLFAVWFYSRVKFAQSSVMRWGVFPLLDILVIVFPVTLLANVVVLLVDAPPQWILLGAIPQFGSMLLFLWFADWMTMWFPRHRTTMTIIGANGVEDVVVIQRGRVDVSTN